MNQEHSRLQRLRQHLDLPPEATPWQTQITLVGHSEVTIQMHKGIGTYAHDQIQVRIRGGYALIYGEDLEIARMNPSRLVICGNIHRVDLEAAT